jgi:1-deoxyxylulose-5-phosphate synthase
LARDLAESTTRYETDQIAKGKYDSTAAADQAVIARVAEVAEKRGVPRSHVSLAWLLQKAPVVAPVIGATKLSHLESAVEALAIKLTAEEVAFLEAPYVPHGIVGYQ